MANIEHHGGGGGWISGPSITHPHRDSPALDSEIEVEPHVDRRPDYSPAAALAFLIDHLHGRGLEFELDPSQMHVSAIAMADVLRGLGVRPANAPER